MALLLALVPQSPAGSRAKAVRIRLEDEGRWLQIVEKRPGRKWKARLGDELWTLKKKPNGKLVVKWGKQVVAKGRVRDRRLKLKDPYGYEYLKIKFKKHKIKIYLVSSYSYDLKPKGEGWKVQWGSMELGEVVKQDGGWAAKDSGGGVKARCSGRAPSVALTPFLMDGVEGPKRVVLALIFMALEYRY